MKGFEEQKGESFFSEEQNEKLRELTIIFNSLLFSLNSDEASFVNERIERFGVKLSEKYDPEKYFLWSMLSGGFLTQEENNLEFDTPEGDIESFIRELPEILGSYNDIKQHAA